MNNMKTAKLKSIDQLKKEFSFMNDSFGGLDIDLGCDDCDESCENCEKPDWSISELMIPIFGNGKYYTFESIHFRDEEYTHALTHEDTNNSRFFYHESWFESDDILTEEDFKI